MSSPTHSHFSARARLAQRRAVRSRLLVKIAVLAGAGFALAFVAQGFLFPPASVPKPVEAPASKSNVIIGGASSFSGVDVNGKAFSVRASGGHQDGQDPTLMHLQSVTSTFVRNSGGQVHVSADGADYEVKTKDLALIGNVMFEEPGVYVARLQSAEVNLEQQRITTNQPVQVQASGATILADAMETSEDGSVIRLHGNVRATFIEPNGQ